MREIIDFIYGILVAAVGISFLVTPYDKLKERMPKAPAQNVVKSLGILLVILGICLIILAAMGIF